MSFLVRTRAELMADYVIESGATVRQTAVYFGISKSTVHKDLTDRLKKSNKALYDEVSKVLFKNKAERHIRGGEATRKKYLKEKTPSTKVFPCDTNYIKLCRKYILPYYIIFTTVFGAKNIPNSQKLFGIQ